MRIAEVLDFFDTDYFNSACTTWPDLDPDHALASHATRQAVWVVYDESNDDRIVGFACQWCGEELTAS